MTFVLPRSIKNMMKIKKNILFIYLIQYILLYLLLCIYKSNGVSGSNILWQCVFILECKIGRNLILIESSSISMTVYTYSKEANFYCFISISIICHNSFLLLLWMSTGFHHNYSVDKCLFHIYHSYFIDKWHAFMNSQWLNLFVLLYVYTC